MSYNKLCPGLRKYTMYFEIFLFCFYFNTTSSNVNLFTHFFPLSESEIAVVSDSLRPRGL